MRESYKPSASTLQLAQLGSNPMIAQKGWPAVVNLQLPAARGLVVSPINGDWERMSAEENSEEAIGRFLNKLKLLPSGQ